MADKQLSGFEISQGEPLDVGAEACAQDLKRIISMIDEHLSQETYVDTYVRKRRISKRQATLMALDLDMSGLDGVADVETAAGSLNAKLHAIRTAVSEHGKTDTDDDEPEEPELPLAVDWLSVPLEKGAHASVLLVPLPAVADVANHKDSLALLRDEYAVAAAITRTNLNELLKAWVEIAPDGARPARTQQQQLPPSPPSLDIYDQCTFPTHERRLSRRTLARPRRHTTQVQRHPARYHSRPCENRQTASSRV